MAETEGRRERDLDLVEEFETVRAVTSDGRSVRIPKSKIGGNLETATETVLGGIKAAAKTEKETVEAKIDPVTGKLFVPKGGSAPDDEDITLAEIEGEEKLQFKDKLYNASTYSGLGRKYLRKNMVNEVNVLTQDFFSNEDGTEKTNTRYIIQYDYDLNGATITIPEGCTLEFQGGSISNGSIFFNNTIIVSPYSYRRYIYHNIMFYGYISGDFLISYVDTNISALYNAKMLHHLTKAIFDGGGNIIWDVPYMRMEIYAGYGGITLQNGINDFGGITFEVLNNTALCYLFAKKETEFNVIEATSIADAVANEVFKNKIGILRVYDQTPFAERYGYGYSAYRKDILLVQDNKLMYEPIATYDDGESNPVYSYIIPDHSITIRNIKFVRDKDSTYKTLFCNIIGEKDLVIDNVTIETVNTTEENADESIYLLNIFNLKLSNIKINGTYSTTSSFGYGIELNGVSKVVIENIALCGNWGVIGTNNVNGVVVRDSILDRWDCHCYSKNVMFENCKFYNLYTSYSYHAGYIHYKNCDLTNVRPFLNDESYGINKNVQLILEGCVLHNCTRLMNNYLEPKVSNRRTLIARDEIPDLYVKNCVFDNPINTYIYPCNIFEVTPVNRGGVSFENCRFLGQRNVISFSSTTTNLDINISNVDFNPVYQYYAYDEFRHIIINSVNAKVNISKSKFSFYYGIVNNTNDIRVHIEDSIVYNARYKDIELDKRYTFDRCTLILDNLDENETKVYVPFSVFNSCIFMKRSNADTCNIGWFQRGPVFNCCTFLDGVTLGDKNIRDIGELLYISLPYVKVVRPIDSSIYSKLLQSGIGGTYKCWVQNVGYKYVVDGMEVSKQEYYS